MQLSYFVSLLLYASFVVYFLLGVYVYLLRRTSSMHYVFFALCASLCIWAFTYSIATNAPDYATCLFWRRTAALGWGFVYSLLLHFILALTEKKTLLRKKWIYVVLYAPCAVNLFVYTFYTKIAAQQFELIRTSAGWINISKDSGWDLFYYIYYILFASISIILIRQWGKRSHEKSKKIQSFLITGSFLIALVLGTFVEIIINQVWDTKIPQIGPIVILMPVLVMFYCIKKYDLLPRPQKDQQAEAGAILSEATSSKLYSYLAHIYLLGSFLAFALRYFVLGETVEKAFLVSVSALLVGLSLYKVQELAIDTGRKQKILNLIIMISIPLMNLMFIDYTAFYGWIFPVVLLLISIVFSQKQFTMFAGACILLTLIGSWIIQPNAIVEINNIDHITRIVIFLAIIWIAHFIKEVYTHRLEQYEEQVAMQKLNAIISADLVSANEYNIDKKLNEAMKACGEYLDADSANIFFLEENNKEDRKFNAWCRTKPDVTFNQFYRADTAVTPEWMKRTVLCAGEMLYIPKTSEFQGGKGSQNWFEERRLKTFLSIPLIGNNKIIGYFSFAAVNAEKNWNPNQLQMMQMIAHHLTDVWLKVNAEKELKQMAYFDSLTCLPNRTQFSQYLKTGIELAMDYNTLLGVIYLDVDFFKTINDLMGHDSGDELLRQFALRLLSCLRQEDTIARFGGDEFLIMLPYFTNSEDIQQAADRIMATACEPLTVNGQDLFVTASMGIAVYPDDGESPEDLIKNADLALYTSKETGRSKYTFCSQTIKNDFLKKNELTSDLYHALEREEFLLYFQPKVDPRSGRILGLEALIRWQHPQKGLILPGGFIPLAEKIGVIGTIDQWVFRTVCRQSKAWQEQGFAPIRIAVNFSLSQFYKENVLENVQLVLEETGIDLSLIEIEITESIAYYKSEMINDILNGFKALGISISIDDFGTEYSSLIRLQTLPIDRIKIDRRFVRELENGRKSENIMKAIFTLSQALDLKVTVEGVETERQLAFARELSCDEIQGYYFYKPMPADAIETLLYTASSTMGERRE